MLFLNRRDHFVCTSCGSELRFNIKQTLFILLLFSSPPILLSINHVPIHNLRALLLLWMLLFIIVWIFASKVELLSSNNNSLTKLIYAAEHNDLDAKFNLGWIYATGQGVQQDYQRALQLFLEAAEQGHAPSQYNLGVILDEGQGVPKNHQKALQLWQKSAQAGYEPSIKILNSLSLSALASTTSPVPSHTGADAELQLDIINHIAFLEGFSGISGFEAKVLNTRQMKASLELVPEKVRPVLDAYMNTAAANGRKETAWSREEWTIERNDRKIYYEIILIERIEGTDIIVGRVQDIALNS